MCVVNSFVRGPHIPVVASEDCPFHAIKASNAMEAVPRIEPTGRFAVDSKGFGVIVVVVDVVVVVVVAAAVVFVILRLLVSAIFVYMRCCRWYCRSWFSDRVGNWKRMRLFLRRKSLRLLCTSPWV